MSPIEVYASVILHSGCGHTGNLHKWDQCPIQKFYLRIARKHQHKLQSNGLTIGYWVKECPCSGRCHNGHTPTCSDVCYDNTIVYHAPVAQ